VLGRSLEILGIVALQSDGKVWCSFPGKPQIGAGDKPIRDDKARRDLWSNAVIAALPAAGPEIFA
jgi:hypothetical protein